MDAYELNKLLNRCNVTEDQRQQAIEHVQSALQLLGLYDKMGSHKQQHIVDTPRRIVDVWLEFTANMQHEPSNITTFEATSDNLVTVVDIELHSMCSHHLFPFNGIAHVAYLPNKKVYGLSKIPRIVQHFSKQLQVQEELTDEIADYLFKVAEPLFVYVVIEAQHQCCTSRGIHSSTSSMITRARRYSPELGDIQSIMQEANASIESRRSKR